MTNLYMAVSSYITKASSNLLTVSVSPHKNMSLWRHPLENHCTFFSFTNSNHMQN